MSSNNLKIDGGVDGDEDEEGILILEAREMTFEEAVQLRVLALEYAIKTIQRMREMTQKVNRPPSEMKGREFEKYVLGESPFSQLKKNG